eukprot:scaffold147230_cov34-Tisochrysis_lutea.AAC.1
MYYMWEGRGRGRRWHPILERLVPHPREAPEFGALCWCWACVREIRWCGVASHLVPCGRACDAVVG